MKISVKMYLEIENTMAFTSTPGLWFKLFYLSNKSFPFLNQICNMLAQWHGSVWHFLTKGDSVVCVAWLPLYLSVT